MGAERPARARQRRLIVERTQARLLIIARGFKPTAGLSSPPKPSARKEDVAAIQKKAAGLYKAVRGLHLEYPGLLIGAGAREDAERGLVDQGFDADEVALARAGFDPCALRLVLLGLQAHLCAVEERHPENSDEAWRARRLVEIAADEFRKAGLPVSRSERKSPRLNVFAETCAAMFVAAGIVGRKGQTPNPVDLIRELKEGRRKRPPRRKKPAPD